MSRRLLGDMLLEVASDTMDAMSTAPELGVSQISLALPVEFELSCKAGAVQVLGDLPRLVTRTAFDTHPGRIEVIWEAVKQS